MKVYLRGISQVKYVNDPPPSKDGPEFAKWEQEDSSLMGELRHSMDPHVATLVEFFNTLE